MPGLSTARLSQALHGSAGYCFGNARGQLGVDPSHKHGIPVDMGRVPDHAHEPPDPRNASASTSAARRSWANVTSCGDVEGAGDGCPLIVRRSIASRAASVSAWSAKWRDVHLDRPIHRERLE